jgi:hypothetical protein
MSFVDPLEAERMKICGSTGCPSRYRGHKSVHIRHWLQAAIARLISIEGLHCFLRTT